ncbi:hypothetical protein [Roseicella sp. DB1501]|uniref:hypothetical protein n=1 Tax=Roseicella sp. DB1501 TaxID=2730925 RepID=UPI001491F617|nr:hypothetical protein [Roseicella sp. DB1501]NOG69124.1 hypothetical protein [Roseicella sp. DB1501]
MRLLPRAILDGALVVVPLGAIALLLIHLIRSLQGVADPLLGGYLHPLLAAAALLLLLLLVVGLAVRSAIGHWVRQALETNLFERVPGYRLAKALLGNGLPEAAGRSRIRPALAAVEEGHCPALVMEEFADGSLLVFVPGTPAPMSGALYIFGVEKVIFLDVPLLPFLRAISSWGLGMRELLEGAPARPARDAAAGPP